MYDDGGQYIAEKYHDFTERVLKVAYSVLSVCAETNHA